MSGNAKRRGQPKGRSRQLLHVDHVDDFAQFCTSLGWVAEHTEDQYVRLRMRHPEYEHLLIVHRQLDTAAGNPLVHCTVWGWSFVLARQFYQHRKVKDSTRDAK